MGWGSGNKRVEKERDEKTVRRREHERTVVGDARLREMTRNGMVQRDNTADDSDKTSKKAEVA